MRVLIVGDHPWWGHSGEVIGSLKTIMGTHMWKVRLDNGQACGATNQNLKDLTEEAMKGTEPCSSTTFPVSAPSASSVRSNIYPQEGCDDDHR